MAKQRQKAKSYGSPYKRFDKDSDSEGEETELFVKNKSPKKEIPTIEKSVEEEDTLQSIAIRYHCTIEDLKRLNNIHKENEIYAKRTIKVPHRPFTMPLVGVHISGKSSPDKINEPSTSKLIDIEILNTKLSDKVTVKPRDQDEVNKIIFNSKIAQKPSERLCDEIATEIANEEVCLLRSHRIAEAKPIVTRVNFNGADCDISWIALILCIVIMIVAVPLIYVFYIAEHPEKYHHHIS